MAAALICTMTACGSGETKNNDSITGEKENDKLSIVCTIFPEYDWVRELSLLFLSYPYQYLL